MSDMTQCNFCTFRAMKRRGCHSASRAEREALWEKNEKFDSALGAGVVIVDKDGNFAAWFMELPDRCCC